MEIQKTADFIETNIAKKKMKKKLQDFRGDRVNVLKLVGVRQLMIGKEFHHLIVKIFCKSTHKSDMFILSSAGTNTIPISLFFSDSIYNGFDHVFMIASINIVIFSKMPFMTVYTLGFAEAKFTSKIFEGV
jgi:predicted ATPase